MWWLVALYVTVGCFVGHPIVMLLAAGGKRREAFRTFVVMAVSWPLVTPFIWGIRADAVRALDGERVSG
jgi:hypothetical protein